MGILASKRILVTGLLSNRSIAYGIARAAHREGAELAFTYQNERFKGRVTEKAAGFGSSLAFQCDVATGRRVQSSEKVEQRALAGAALPHDRQDFSAMDREIDAGQHLHGIVVAPVIGLAQAPRLDDGGHSCRMASTGVRLAA